MIFALLSQNLTFPLENRFVTGAVFLCSHIADLLSYLLRPDGRVENMPSLLLPFSVAIAHENLTLVVEV